MMIKPLTGDDWTVFTAWADTEGWRISLPEQRLFQSQWRSSFYVLWEGGCRCAFASGVVYDSSGWIGNLIVDPQRRHQGYGSKIFRFVFNQLITLPRIQRIWLTASEQGAPLYRRYGFIDLDRVGRWSAQGSGDELPLPEADLASLSRMDERCWGESRKPLLRILVEDSRFLSAEDSMALLQPGFDFWFLGPWLGRMNSSSSYRRILEQALVTTPRGKRIFTDVLASSAAAMALQQAGFEYLGDNQLMCCSHEPVALNGVVSLASLGSIG